MQRKNCYPPFPYLGRVMRIWYLSPMRAAKVQASLRIRAVSPIPPLLAHISNESRGTFRQKTGSLAPLNGWTCAVKICHDRMLEYTNSLDAPHIRSEPGLRFMCTWQFSAQSVNLSLRILVYSFPRVLNNVIPL